MCHDPHTYVLLENDTRNPQIISITWLPLTPEKYKAQYLLQQSATNCFQTILYNSIWNAPLTTLSEAREKIFFPNCALHG